MSVLHPLSPSVYHAHFYPFSYPRGPLLILCRRLCSSFAIRAQSVRRLCFSLVLSSAVDCRSRKCLLFSRDADGAPPEERSFSLSFLLSLPALLLFLLLSVACEVNAHVENIGARRLHTIIEKSALSANQLASFFS